MVEGSWHRHHDTHERDDHGEDDSAKRMIRQSIDDSSSGKNVETDQEDVISE